MTKFVETEKNLNRMEEILEALEEIEFLHTKAIEDYFTRHIVITFYKEVRKCYEEIVGRACNKIDEHIFKLLTNDDSMDKLISRLMEKRANEKIEDSEINSSLRLYASFLTARRKVAHEDDSDIKLGWGEVNGTDASTKNKKIFQIGDEVIDEIEKYLNSPQSLN